METDNAERPTENHEQAEVQEDQDRAPARLVIKELELENFKSYGGSVRVGPFHKRFSAIVGPNGSGKSNVIDAMLFVFGKRAKQMRLAKISELIHKSSSYPNCDAASVTVAFHEIRDTGDRDEDYDILPESSITVKRTALRNNTSKYYLNGAASSFTQVTEMLKGKGVDLNNNRFLILQGEVEQIAMMKPKAPSQHEDGLLEYLEDIIGSDQFKEPIDSAITALDTFNEERSHRLNRLKGVETERDALREAKEQAEEYLAKSLELIAQKQTLARAHRFDALQQQTVLTNDLETVTKQLDVEREKVKSSVEECKSLTDDIRTASKEHQKASAVLSRARDDFAQFERKDIELRQSLKHLKAKERKLCAAILQDETAAAKYAEEALDAKQTAEDLRHVMEITRAELETAAKELSQEYENVKEATSDLRNELEHQKTSLLPYREQMHEKIQAVETVTAQIALLVGKTSAPQRELQERETQLNVISSELTRLNSAAAQAEEKKTQLISSSEDLKTRISEASLEKDEQTRKRDEFRSTLEGIKSSVANASTRGRIVSALLKACQERELTGVIGQLSELATIDSKYDLAMGAAAAGPLTNIVVETASDAHSCVEYLRKHALGRATFIILEKIEHLRSKMSSPKIGGGTRLFDLLKIPNERHELAFYYALKDTLVAKDLGEGGRLAFQPSRRNRVVTLKGELIETSGAMSGGGGAPRRACLGPNGPDSTDSQAIPKLESELSNVERAITALEDSLSTMKVQLKDTEDGLSTVSLESQKIGVQLLSLKEQSREINGRLPRLRKAVVRAQDPSAAENKEIQANKEKLCQAESDLDNVKRNAAELESKVAQLQQEILDVGGEALRLAKTRQQALQDKLQAEQRDLSKADARLSTSKTSGAKAVESKTEHESERSRVGEEREKVRLEFDALEQDASNIQTQLSNQETTVKTCAAHVASLEQKMSSVEQFLSDFRKREVDVENEIESLKKAVRNFDKRVEDSNVHLESLEDEKTRLTKEANAARNIENHDSCDQSMGEEAVEDGEQDQMTLDGQTRLGVAIRLLEETIAKLSPNTEAIAEYREKNAEYLAKMKELDEVTGQRDEGRMQLETLRKDRLDLFMSGFSIITSKLKEMYQMITLGGDAELELVDSLDPFSEGIEFSVRPPKKSWKNISNLSGGEKTLSSLALVFALHHFKPTPLYFMDEIDAALDFKNVSIVANYVKDRTKNAQFIIISLRNNMFELADRLVGIYKTSNTTKSVTINPKAFVVPVSAG